MSFLLNANPLKGVLCVPYHYLWLTVILAWFLTLLEAVWMWATYQWSNHHIQDRAKTIYSRVNQNMVNIMQAELTSVKITYNDSSEPDSIPNEIIAVIMSFLPEVDDAYQPICRLKRQQVETNAIMAISTTYIYPVVRSICNIINLVNLLIRYVEWYNVNYSTSTRYCALIMIMFYVPIFNGRGFMRLIQYIFRYSIKTNRFKKFKYWEHPFLCALWMDILYLIFVSIVAFPILCTDTIIFIPSICVACLGGVVMTFIVSLTDCCFRDTPDGRDDAMTFSLALAIPFCISWGVAMMMFSTMEFYGYKGYDWIHAWETGFLGTYCDPNDYFAFSKFSQYDWDIRVLIISWFIF